MRHTFFRYLRQPYAQTKRWPVMPYLLASILAILQLVPTVTKAGKPVAVRRADVIIYGGTSAAITAAVQVQKMGKSVIVVSPDKHLGGLSSGGLGYTDTGNKEVIGGLSREFYQRLYTTTRNSAWNWEKRRVRQQRAGDACHRRQLPHHVDF